MYYSICTMIVYVPKYRYYNVVLVNLVRDCEMVTYMYMYNWFTAVTITTKLFTKYQLQCNS